MKSDLVRMLGIVAVAGIVAVGGCSQKPASEPAKPVGVAEKTGAAVDKAAQKTTEAVNTAVEKTVEVATGRQDVQVLSDAEVEKLAMYGKIAENHYGVPQDVEVSASVEDVTVSYGDPFSDGFFSPRKCQRNLDLRLTLTAKQCRGGKILWAGDEPASLTDTVNVADVPLLEQSTEHIAKGIHPQRSILERLIEPFIIVGATGVAIYLFFTIRS